jgi:hypothetical protein
VVSQELFSVLLFCNATHELLPLSLLSTEKLFNANNASVHDAKAKLNASRSTAIGVDVGVATSLVAFEPLEVQIRKNVATFVNILRHKFSLASSNSVQALGSAANPELCFTTVLCIVASVRLRPTGHTRDHQARLLSRAASAAKTPCAV